MNLKMRFDELDITRRIETNQTTAPLKLVRILRRVLETWGNLLSPRLSANTGVKNE